MLCLCSNGNIAICSSVNCNTCIIRAAFSWSTLDWPDDAVPDCCCDWEVVCWTAGWDGCDVDCWAIGCERVGIFPWYLGSIDSTF